ncbi:hypothetical protein [Actinomadura sp. B10D3]|uniref:hypothetical protein n=1 Tax=Actinomadura sp. B10D3 TaxID=3153557 RepID=UPI00325F846E
MTLLLGFCAVFLGALPALTFRLWARVASVFLFATVTIASVAGTGDDFPGSELRWRVFFVAGIATLVALVVTVIAPRRVRQVVAGRDWRKLP